MMAQGFPWPTDLSFLHLLAVTLLPAQAGWRGLRGSKEQLFTEISAMELYSIKIACCRTSEMLVISLHLHSSSPSLLSFRQHHHRGTSCPSALLRSRSQNISHTTATSLCHLGKIERQKQTQGSTASQGGRANSNSQVPAG